MIFIDFIHSDNFPQSVEECLNSIYSNRFEFDSNLDTGPVVLFNEETILNWYVNNAEKYGYSEEEVYDEAATAISGFSAVSYAQKKINILTPVFLGATSGTPFYMKTTGAENYNYLNILDKLFPLNRLIHRDFLFKGSYNIPHILLLNDTENREWYSKEKNSLLDAMREAIDNNYLNSPYQFHISGTYKDTEYNEGILFMQTPNPIFDAVYEEGNSYMDYVENMWMYLDDEVFVLLFLKYSENILVNAGYYREYYTEQGGINIILLDMLRTFLDNCRDSYKDIFPNSYIEEVDTKIAKTLTDYFVRFYLNYETSEDVKRNMCVFIEQGLLQMSYKRNSLNRDYLDFADKL